MINTNSVILLIKDQAVKNEFRELISSLEGYRILNSHEPKSCDILVLEVGDNLKEEFQMIQDLQKSGLVQEIFLTSSHTEPEILLQALRSGAKEYFPQPLKRDDLLNAFHKFKNGDRRSDTREARRKKGKIINIIGAKGGIGTTTVAVNFATSLLDAKDIQSVALIDMNLLFGEVPLFLDIDPAFNWGEVAKNIFRLDATYLMGILSRHPSSGLYVLPSPTGIDGANVATPDIIEKLLLMMQGVFDYIVIDSGQSLDEISLKVIELSDTVFINSILSLPCLINVKRLLETCMRLGYPPEDNVKIIINRYHKNSVISLKEAEKGIQKKIFWIIPNDYQATISAINQGKTLSAVAHKSDITKNLRELAMKLTATAEQKKERAGFLSLKFSEAKT